jgi:phenylacetate-CoA ligase
MAAEDFLHPLLGSYINAPQWVKSTVGRLYSAVPVSLLRGRHYASFLEEAGRVDDAASLGADKLRETLGWALSTVPAYSEYRELADDLSDPYAVLQALPLTSKNQLRTNLPCYLSRNISAAARLPTFTGGSTTVPLSFYLQRGVSRPKEYAFMQRFHERAGYTGSDLVLSLRGRSVPGAGADNPRLWMYDPIKNQLMFSCDHLDRARMPHYAKALRKWNPVAIQAYPSALYPLARWLAEYPDPSITARIKSVMLYSENPYEFQMELFREVFKCPIVKHYGHSERILMAGSLPDDEQYVFWPQYGHVELITPDGNPVTRPGVLGEIVGTGFDNRVLPFIRYRTGDLGMWSAQGITSLPGYRVLEKIEGRVQEFVVCKDLRLVSITTLGAAHFRDLPHIEKMQYEQMVPGELILRVVTDRVPVPGWDRLLAEAIWEKTQGGCVLKIMQVDDIPRTINGKHRMLIQHIKLDQFYGQEKNHG